MTNKPAAHPWETQEAFNQINSYESVYLDATKRVRGKRGNYSLKTAAGNLKRWALAGNVPDMSNNQLRKVKWSEVAASMQDE